MPPLLALLLTILLIGFLFLRDYRREPDASPWLWIPLLWLLILLSRPLAVWLDPGLASQSITDIEGGNQIDRVVLLALMGGGLFAVMGRNQLASIGQILKKNVIVLLFFAYCALSIYWSDYSFVALKRWIREMGSLLMLLIILTAPGYPETLKWVLRRCGYVLIPLSIMLIKYFPEYSKYYDPWSGSASYIGVTMSKNMLGILCLMLGLFFTWEIIAKWRTKKDPVDFIFLGSILWLLFQSQSMTSMLVLLIGMGLLFFFHVLGERTLRVVDYVMLTIVFFAALDVFFESEISGTIFEMLGRDRTLTGRTQIWELVVGLVPNPLIGTGYESFWLGERLTKIWEIYWHHPNQAHNGYLEIYLNLGWIGLALFAGVAFSAYVHGKRVMTIQFDYGSFQIVLWVAALLLNMTEAVFKEGSAIWLLFLIVAMDPDGMEWHEEEEPDD